MELGITELPQYLEHKVEEDLEEIHFKHNLSSHLSKLTGNKSSSLATPFIEILDILTRQKIVSQGWSVGQALEDAVHVAGVAKVLEPWRIS